MNSEILFNKLFGAGKYSITIDGFFIEGYAKVGSSNTKVIGTCRSVAIDSALALRISEVILKTIEEDLNFDKRPIIFLVDTQGHKLSRQEEFLGINGYFAHMAKCIYLAGCIGHKTVSIIHGEAVSGCFLAFGMMPNIVCALEGSKIYVMDIKAMSKITKIDYDILLKLSDESPVFAPGIENFYKLGGVHEIWKEYDNWNERLIQAINKCKNEDNRIELALERCGRLYSKKIVDYLKNMKG